MGAFKHYHPVTSMLYFTIIMLISIQMMHPLIVGSTWLGAMLLYLLLLGGKRTVRELAFYFGVAVLLVIVTPIVSHNGTHRLFFLNDNAVTLEAICYGLYFGLLIMILAFWVKSFLHILGMEQLFYLLKKVNSRIAYFVTITLMFVPKFKRKFVQIQQVQIANGFYSRKSRVDQLLCFISVVRAVTLWSLEQTITAAEVLKVKGYGLANRTFYEQYVYKRKDILLSITILALYITYVMYSETFKFYIYPTFAPIQITFQHIAISGIMAVFFIYPVIVELKEHIKWKYLQSKI